GTTGREVDFHAEIVTPETDKTRRESRRTERSFLHHEFPPSGGGVCKPAKATTFTVAIRWGRVPGRGRYGRSNRGCRRTVGGISCSGVRFESKKQIFTATCALCFSSFSSSVAVRCRPGLKVTPCSWGPAISQTVTLPGLRRRLPCWMTSRGRYLPPAITSTPTGPPTSSAPATPRPGAGT